MGDGFNERRARSMGCGCPAGALGHFPECPQFGEAIRDLQRCLRCGRRRIEHRVDNIGLARCSDDGDADFPEEASHA